MSVDIVDGVEVVAATLTVCTSNPLGSAADEAAVAAADSAARCDVRSAARAPSDLTFVSLMFEHRFECVGGRFTIILVLVLSFRMGSLFDVCWRDPRVRLPVQCFRKRSIRQ